MSIVCWCLVRKRTFIFSFMFRRSVDLIFKADRDYCSVNTFDVIFNIWIVLIMIASLFFLVVTARSILFCIMDILDGLINMLLVCVAGCNFDIFVYRVCMWLLWIGFRICMPYTCISNMTVFYWMRLSLWNDLKFVL